MKNDTIDDDIGYVSINGVAVDDPKQAKISIWDRSFHRGDGVFEVMKLLMISNKTQKKEENDDDDDDNDDDYHQDTNTTAAAVVKIRSLKYHLERLRVSANGVGCPLPTDEILTEWLQDAASSRTTESSLRSTSSRSSSSTTTTTTSIISASPPGAGFLRLIATKGQQDGGSAPSSVIISWSPQPKWPTSFSLCPILAPWHPAGAIGWEIPIKWTSYGPNVVSTRKAQQAGHTDALLVSADRLVTKQMQQTQATTTNTLCFLKNCHVLDGPNFAIGWISNGICYFPCSKTLGLLPSITQRLVARILEEKKEKNDNDDMDDIFGARKVEWGVYTLQNVLEADEVFVMSTTRGVIPVTKIGDTMIGNCGGGDVDNNKTSSSLSSFVAQIQRRLDKIEA